MIKKTYLYYFAATLLVSLLIVLPTIIGVVHKIPGKVFTGNTFFFDPWDVNVYVSAINRSQTFGFDFENMYTTEDFPTNVNLYPLYSMTGIVFKHANPFVLYYLLIILSISLYLAIIKKLLPPEVENEKDKYIFLVILSAAGGFGWVSFGRVPSADISTTPFTFLNLLQRPHATIAVAFYIAALMAFYFYTKNKNYKYFVYSTISLLIFSIFYPYLLLSFFTTLFLYSTYLFYKKKSLYALKGLVKIFFISVIPTGLYSMYILRGSQFESVLSPDLPPPPLPYALLGHGMFLIGFVYQTLKKQKDPGAIFFMIWYSVGIILSYSPFSFSRYYFGGLFFPLLMLVFQSKNSFLTLANNNHFRKYLKIAFIFFGTLTSVVIVITRILAVVTANKWSYLDNSYLSVLNFLRTKTPAGSGVVSKYSQSNFIPVYTLNKVYVGHGAQTVNAQEKFDLQDKFYKGSLSRLELQQIIDSNVNYAIVETSNLNGVLVYNSDLIRLEVIYQNENYSLIKFQESGYAENRVGSPYY